MFSKVISSVNDNSKSNTNLTTPSECNGCNKCKFCFRFQSNQERDR